MPAATHDVQAATHPHRRDFLASMGLGLAADEVRAVRAGKVGRYYNSGAAGRFAGLIWALELTPHSAEVVGWHVEPDGGCRKYRFEPKDAAMFSYFEARRTDERVA